MSASTSVHASARQTLDPFRRALYTNSYLLKTRLPRALSPAAAVLIGAIAGAIIAMAVPNNASAAIDCAGHYFDDMSTTATHYGTGVNGAYGMFAFNHTPVTCTYTSSVLARDPLKGDVEVGWIDGVPGVEYSHYNDNIQGCKDSGTANWSTGKGHPEAFRATVRIGDTGYRCTVFPAVTPSVAHYHQVDVQNSDGNLTWSFYLDGSNLGGGSLTLPFSTALSWTNAEQYGGNEQADASFRGLQFMNPSGAWVDWSGAMCQYPRTIPSGLTDPYNSHIETAYTWIQVLTTGTRC